MRSVLLRAGQVACAVALLTGSHWLAEGAPQETSNEGPERPILRPPIQFPSAPARLEGRFQAGKRPLIFLTFPNENVVRVLNRRGKVVQVFDEVAYPVGIAIRGPRAYIGSTGDGSVQVRKLRGGRLAEQVGYLGSGPGEFTRPSDVVVHPTTRQVYVSDVQAGKVRVFNPKTLAEIAELGPGLLENPSGMAFAPDGTLYVCDLMEGEVKYFAPDWSYQGNFTFQGDDPGETMRPIGVCWHAPDRVLVADSFFGQVLVFSAPRVLLSTAGNIGKGDGLMENPLDVLVDPLDGEVLVLDSGDRELEFFRPDL